MRAISRRRAIATVLTTGALVATGPRLLLRRWAGASVLAASNDTVLAVDWAPVNGNPVVVTYPNPADPTDAGYSERLFPTLMNIEGKISPNPAYGNDIWYMWAWQHADLKSGAPGRMYLYTAPGPAGPWTFREYTQPPSPGLPGPGQLALAPDGYDQGHFSAGEVVWDPVGRRFIATPHSLRVNSMDTVSTPGRDEDCQDSFIIESADGVTWSWLNGDNSPRLPCGAPGDVDSVHTGYGRLLRQLDGSLVTIDGSYWWIYRAQRHDAKGSQAGQKTITPYLARSSDLNTWVKVGPAFPTVYDGHEQGDFGCFVEPTAGGSQFVYYNVTPNPGPVPSTTYLNVSTPGSPLTWATPGVVVPIELGDNGNLSYYAPNVTIRPDTGVQHMIVSASRATYLLENIVDSTAPAGVSPPSFPSLPGELADVCELRVYYDAAGAA